MKISKHTLRSGLLALAACLAMLAPVAAHAGAVIQAIKSRGELRCGVSEGIPGFSARDANGNWSGLDIDFCRALAAALLGDPQRVAFVPLKSSMRFPALEVGKVDLLARNTTWTMEREVVLRLEFPGVLFYDGQGFMVAKKAKVRKLADLSGTTVCVEKGTNHQRNLLDYFSDHKMSVKLLVIDSASGAAQALFAGRCLAYSSDSAQLAAMRLTAPEGAKSMAILPERISKEPLGPVLKRGDDDWYALVRWVLYALIMAEERGVTRANVDNVLPKLVLYEDKNSPATALGVSPGWGQRAIKAVGNYGEMYERNVGRDSPLGIERGLNRLWDQGGLMYAPPLR